MSLVAATPESAGLSSERLARIRPAMQAVVDSGKAAGIHTTITRKGKVVHDERVGSLDPATGAPLPADAIYRIYSMTKPIVCVALMTLYEEGRFHLYTPAARFLPALAKMRVLEVAPDGSERLADLARPITFADLLTHTAGFSYSFLDSPACALYLEHAPVIGNSQLTLSELIANACDLPLAYQPGSRWHYSIAIDVAAHLAEIVADRPLRDLLQERIFEPLGMTDTDYGVPVGKRNLVMSMRGVADITTPGTTMTTMFELWQQGVNLPLDVSQTYPVDQPERFMRGGHGLFSTAADYLRFAQMMLNGGELDGTRILGRKTLEVMHTNHVPRALLPYELGGVAAPGYGFGLGERVLEDVGLSNMMGSPGEFGWSGAAKTYYWCDPAEEMVGVFMTQLQSPDEPQMTFRTLAYQAIVD